MIFGKLPLAAFLESEWSNYIGMFMRSVWKSTGT